MPRHERFVSHIDILGMSTLVEKNAELAWQVLSDLVSVRDRVNSYELTFLDTADRTTVPSQVHCVTFSDTIVLFSKGESLIDLRTILVATTEILHKAICSCVPVRAGVAHGTFFFNLGASMYAGPALIEAYRLGEGAQWLGIRTSESVHIRSKHAELKSGSADIVVPARIPVDGGVMDGFAVNWPAIVSRDLKIKPPVSVQQFYAGFEHLFGPFEALPERARQKYENTVLFLNSHVLEGA